MQIVDTVTLAAPRDSVVAALTDPAVLQACIPGCSAVTRLAGQRYEVRVCIPTGLRPLTFIGVVRFDLTEAPDALSILRGGNGRADITLTENDGTTILRYRATAQVGGSVRFLGEGMLTGIARRMTAGFFDRLSAQL